ncbi:MAG: zinc ribbon domain-containing protein [Clostridia bacterium]|nr:zinc ribbon domain-containing protein [Clostridia bacterium]
MKTCPGCAAIMADDSAKCGICGKKLKRVPIQKICSGCRTTIPKSATKCPACNQKLKKNKEYTLCVACNALIHEQEKKCPVCNNYADGRSSGGRGTALLLLLPAVLYAVYLFLKSQEIVPESVVIGNLLIEFFAFGDSPIMTVLAVIFFVTFPFIAVILLIAGKKKKYVSVQDGDGRSRRRSARGRKNEAQGIQESERLFQAENVLTEPDDESAVECDALERIVALERELAAEPGLGAIHGADADKERSFSEVAEDIQGFALSKGLAISKETAGRLLAAVATDCIMIVDERDAERTVKVLGMLAEYFGGSLHPHSAGLHCTFPQQLAIIESQNGEKVESGFLRDIYSACMKPQEVRFGYLYDVDTAHASKYLREYITAIECRHTERYATIDCRGRGKVTEFVSDGKIYVPQNFRLVITPVYGSDLTALSLDTVSLDMSDISVCPPERSTGRVMCITSEALSAMSVSARDNYYLSEAHWKKIDELEAYLADKIGYAITNRRMQSMEIFSSVCLASGCTEDYALDRTVAACIISELYPRRSMLVADEEGENIVEFLERVFGAYDAPATLETARRLLNNLEGDADSRDSEETAVGIGYAERDSEEGLTPNIFGAEIRLKNDVDAEAELYRGMIAEVDDETSDDDE